MIDKVWSKWTGLKKNVKIGIIIVAIVVIYWFIKWTIIKWNLMVSPIIETIGLPHLTCRKPT